MKIKSDLTAPCRYEPGLQKTYEEFARYAVTAVLPDRPGKASGLLKKSQAAQKGPAARRRPKVVREAYSLYVERATEGANEADGPFSAAC